jgi:hypothetical protein
MRRSSKFSIRGAILITVPGSKRTFGLKMPAAAEEFAGGIGENA